MRIEPIIVRFSANAEAIRALVTDVTDEQARWKPAPARWSILEVVNHLEDEERDDFRMRINLTLHHPDTPWPGIDPEGWARDRRYNERDPAESIERFLGERRRSLAWLRELAAANPAPDWDRARTHPVAGELRAGDLLASWLAHDLLHVKQLARLHFDYQAARLAPYAATYAGEWT
jgi:hypothetical protein